MNQHATQQPVTPTILLKGIMVFFAAPLASVSSPFVHNSIEGKKSSSDGTHARTNFFSGTQVNTNFLNGTEINDSRIERQIKHCG